MAAMKILMFFLYSNHDQIPYLQLCGEVTKRNRKGEKEGNKKDKGIQGNIKRILSQQKHKTKLKATKRTGVLLPTGSQASFS